MSALFETGAIVLHAKRGQPTSELSTLSSRLDVDLHRSSTDAQNVRDDFDELTLTDGNTELDLF